VGRRAIAAWAGDRAPARDDRCARSREAIDNWLDDALVEGIDPL